MGHQNIQWVFAIEDNHFLIKSKHPILDMLEQHTGIAVYWSLKNPDE